MQTFSSQRTEIDTQIDNYMYDVIFNNSADLRSEKSTGAGQNYLTKKDNKSNKTALRNIL